MPFLLFKVLFSLFLIQACIAQNERFVLTKMYETVGSDMASIVSVQANQRYFYRHGSNSIVHIWDMDSDLQDPLYTISEVSQIQDFAVEEYSGDFCLLDTAGTVHVYSISTGTLRGTITVGSFDSLSQVAFTRPLIIVSKTGNSSQAVASSLQYYQTFDLAYNGSDSFTNIDSEFRLLAEGTEWEDKKLHVFGWDSQSEFQMFRRHQTDGALVANVYSGMPTNLYQWMITDVACSYYCEYASILVDSEVQVRETESGALLGTYASADNLQVAHTKILGREADKKDLLALFYRNGTIVYHLWTNYTTSQFEETYRYDFGGDSPQHNFVSALDETYYKVEEGRIRVYLLECLSASVLSMQYCNDPATSIPEPGTGETETEFKVVESIQEPLLFIAKVSFFVIVIAKTVPMSLVMLKFINFWTVCSLYAMLDMKEYPPVLKQLLSDIYSMISSSFLDIFNIRVTEAIKDQLSMRQRATGAYRDEFLISTNVVSILADPLVSALFMTLSVLCYEKILLWVFCQERQKSWRLKDKFLSYLLQYISFITSFSLPAVFLVSDFAQQGFADKLGLGCLVTFFSVALICPFVIIFSNRDYLGLSKVLCKLQNNKSSTQKSLRTKTRKFISTMDLKDECHKSEHNLIRLSCKQLLIHYLSYFQIGAVNLLFPILMTLNLPYVFIGGGLLLLIVGFGVVWKNGQSKINDLLLSLELILYHVLFSVLLFIQNEVISVDSFTTKVNASGLLETLIIGVLFAGASHELLTVVVSVCHEFFNFVKKILKSKKVQPDPTNQNQTSKTHRKKRTKKVVQLKSVKFISSKGQKFKNADQEKNQQDLTSKSQQRQKPKKIKVKSQNGSSVNKPKKNSKTFANIQIEDVDIKGEPPNLLLWQNAGISRPRGLKTIRAQQKKIKQLLS